MNNWFDIDNLGWKRMNVGRPPYELVKELIQNVLDEDFNIVNINYNFKNNVFSLIIEDDIKGGISNSSLITTVFMTDKEDSHLKRGRKGRGLKEFLSVCKNAIVETVGKTVEFCEDGTRKEYSNNREIGTKISCVIIEENWNRNAVSEINKYLRKIIINNGTIFINGKKVGYRKILNERYACRLTTQIIENNKQKDKDENTIVSVYDKIDKNGWIYEMGIPVCTTDIPYDINIHQRIPLNDNRNEISNYYMRRVKKFVIKIMLDSLNKKDFIGWASEGIETPYNFDYKEREIIVSKILEDDLNMCFIKSKNRVINDRAKQKGFVLFDINSLNSDLQCLVSNVLKTADQIISEIEKDCEFIEVEPTSIEEIFIQKHKELIKESVGKDIKFRIIEKPKDNISGSWTLALHSVKDNCSIISYNRLAINKRVFENPYSPVALDILIHELAHEDSDKHEHEFINALTKYSGIIISYLMNKNKKSGSNKLTVKDDIKNILKESGFDYLSLKEIYEKMGVVTSNDKAGIRSILNRECSNNGIFERHYDGGKYRLAFKLLVA